MEFTTCCELRPSLFAPEVSPLPWALPPPPLLCAPKWSRSHRRQHPSVLGVLGHGAWERAHPSHHPAAAQKCLVKRKNYPTSSSLPYFILIRRSWGGRRKRERKKKKKGMCLKCRKVKCDLLESSSWSTHCAPATTGASLLCYKTVQYPCRTAYTEIGN